MIKYKIIKSQSIDRLFQKTMSCVIIHMLVVVGREIFKNNCNSYSLRNFNIIIIIIL